MTAGPPSITLVLSDTTLRAAFVRALADAGVAPDGAILVLETTGGLAGLSDAAAGAVEAFKAQGDGRGIVLVASRDGVGWDALQGLARGYAAAFAPLVRVNAIAPARAGGDMDAQQASAALIYLLKADAVTGQTIFVGAEV